MHRPSIIAHRGASGYEIENSRAAFRRALLLDADGVELDVHATHDGALVVHHDALLPDLGHIGDLAAGDVATFRLRNGESIPHLDEVFALLGDRDVRVEVKTLPERYDGVLLATLDAGPGRYSVHSFDHRIVHRLHRRRASLRLGCLVSSYLLDHIAVLRSSGALDLWQEWPLIDPALVDAVHEAGGEIIAWTVNAMHDAVRLADLGVDGLCGNFPDRLRAAVSSGRGSVPAATSM
jgi:glycerophosphoryl diester phosphodiesterase